MRFRGPLARIEAANRTRTEGKDDPAAWEKDLNAKWSTYQGAIRAKTHFTEPAASPSVTPERESLSAPVIGFRAWNLDQRGHLCAIVDGTAWQTTMKARCRHSTKHEAPEHFCECGLYAYYDPNVAIQGIVGAILAWGKLEAHREGFRAEYARILALSVMDDHLTILRHNDVCPTVVPFENLEAFAREHGDPVPEKMRFH